WVGMQLGAGDLVLWSFLMSSLHGAGFMLFPFLVGDEHADPLGAGAAVAEGLAAAAVHSLAMLVTMGAVALVVFEVVGTDILRRTWFSLDRLWAFALVGAGVAVLVV